MRRQVGSDAALVRYSFFTRKSLFMYSQHGGLQRVGQTSNLVKHPANLMTICCGCTKLSQLEVSSTFAIPHRVLITEQRSNSRRCRLFEERIDIEENDAKVGVKLDVHGFGAKMIVNRTRDRSVPCHKIFVGEAVNLVAGTNSL